ncbi:MAG: peptidoglycan DD-metalloendopeptidase family protein [Rhodomicrobium sp.]
MSNVVKGARVPSRFRAAVNLTLSCVLLSGCSSVSDRFSSASFGSGYGAQPPAGEAAASSPKVAANAPAPAQPQPAPYRTQPAGGYQLASASPTQNGGYLQVSRVDLPPLPQQQPPQGTKVADGYGPYNQPPLPDGTYTGPRVYTPYDGPRGDAPPPQVYVPDSGDPRRFDRGAPPPPPSYYRPSDAPPPPAYAPAEEARGYQPGNDNAYAGQPPYPADGRPAYARGPEPGPATRPWRGRTEGQTVAVAPGDTVYTLARRYGVTVDMIARANGLTTVYVRPGTKLFIPRADPTSYAQAPVHAPGSQTAACSGPHCHVVQPGDTLWTIARAHGLTSAQLAEANNLRDRALRPGQALIIPGEKDQSRQAIASAERADRQYRSAPDLKAPPPGSARLADRSGRPVPVPLQPAPDVKTAELTPLIEPSCEAALANPQPRMGSTFRKPVDGKTIAQFGPQKDGTVNEGITISVPKGTPVKAAENGVVAYVGDELPGFGNLILIRHADEYVTAYAHADTVLVKKCDVVRRGQTVATAGTTGDASQPQLHFEIRKNSKPIDPAPLLGS